MDSSSESETEWSDDETEETLLKATPAQKKPLQHPHFGGKRPKKSHAPLKCINISCREEKTAKDKEILRLKEKVKVLEEELRKFSKIGILCSVYKACTFQ